MARPREQGQAMASTVRAIWKANCQVISCLLKSSLFMVDTSRAELWVSPATAKIPRVVRLQPTTRGTKYLRGGLQCKSVRV